MDVDPKNLDLRHYVIVDPEQTDLEQYATGKDENPPAFVFPYGVTTTDGRILWGVVPRSWLPMLLERIEFGGCYEHLPLAGDPPAWLLEEFRDDSGGGEATGWRDAYTVEHGKEEKPYSRLCRSLPAHSGRLSRGWPMELSRAGTACP